MQTTRLKLPFLAAGQAQKHVTLNESLRLVDAVTHILVQDRHLATPPASPAEGAAWLVADGATGSWAGRSGSLATWQDGGWNYTTPIAGMLAFVQDERALAVFDGTQWVTLNVDALTRPIREVLTAARTYFVRTDGSDSNSGLSNTAGGAFRTIQKAYDTISRNLDVAGMTVTIQVADGTYTSGLTVSIPWVGGGNINLVGNTTTPGNVIFNISNYPILVLCNLPGVLSVSGLRLNAGASAIFFRGGGVVSYSSVVFGTCGSAHLEVVGAGARIVATGDYSIAGNALAHWLATGQGQIEAAGRAITFSATAAFGIGFAYAGRLSQILCNGSSFSGAAIGPRYGADGNSVIFTNGGGANYLPGNSAGTVTSGGQYL